MIQYNNRKNSYPYAEHLSRINQLLGYYSEYFTEKLAKLRGFKLTVRFELTPEAKQNTQNQRSTSDPSGHGQVSIPLKHSRKYLCFSVTRTVLYTIKYDYESLIVLLSQRDALSLLKINEDELQRSLTELIMLACLELSEHIDIEKSRAHLSASEVPGGMFDSDPVADSEFGTPASSVYTRSLDEPLRLLQFNLKEICHMLGYYLMIENSQGHSNSDYQRKSFLPYRESISFSAENNSLEVFIVDTNQPIWDFNWREELNEKGDRITAFRYVISAGLLRTLSSMKQFELRDHILISIFAHTLRSKKRRTASQTTPRYYQSLDCIDDFKNRAQVYKVAILITLW
ncbi:MAG: hypothetical protein NZO16_07390, partial [Deltaproteobacteria bacterium]|nr:hypothetical protein [Deltaproteobacteria bacterium]